MPGASGWSLPQPPSRDGRRDGLSPSTPLRSHHASSLLAPSFSLPVFLRLQDLAEKSPPRFQAAPSFTAPAGEGGEGAQIPLPHPSIGTATSPSKGHAPTGAAVLLFCSSLASRCAPLPRKGLFPLAQGLPGSGLGAAWHSAVLGPAVIPSAHVCTRVALQELRGTQKMSSQLPPQALTASLAPAQKSPPATASSTAAPGADERGTLCGAANSSELNQRRGRIAKPPEMKPKKSLSLFSANREPWAEATSRMGAQ